MRTMNSLKNVLSNFANNLLLNILRFVSRIIFIKVLDEVYLGVNGLLSNVLGLLALSELGISTAISYSLYDPLSKNDESKIKRLMTFYKKAYLIIAGIVLVLGLILLPFLPFFIKDTSGIENLNLIYLIFLGNMVISYLFSYKRTLISADQKNYKITPILMFYSFLTTALQIAVLLIFKNYIIYLLMQSLCTILENITVNHYINKNYPYLKELKISDKLDKEESKTIFKNVKALMYHKAGSYVLSATDNLVISKFIGIVMVGVYSNYILIVNMINSFITVFINNVTASFGNLIAKEKGKKVENVFNEMDLICYFLYGISTVCFITLFTPFIEWVFGKNFVLPLIVVIILAYKNYLVGMNIAPITIQSAAGLYNNDRYVPIIQSIVNIILSIALVFPFGVGGVILGTLLSQLIPYVIKPVIIYRHVFNDNVLKYFKHSFKQILVLILATIITCLIVFNIPELPVILKLIIRLILSLVIPLTLMILFFRKGQDFKDLKERIKYTFNAVKGKVKA